MNSKPPLPYTGRFAPSPTGPLHFGSLLAAVASYCDARAHEGRWLVRMEDLDPPREVPGAASRILATLENYGLIWDGEVIYQSTRHDAYEHAIHQLQEQGDIFWCTCSRSLLARSSDGIYPGTCRANKNPLPEAAIRFHPAPGIVSFNDRLFGLQTENVAEKTGDFVIKRRDGLYAYQLAVVTDDEWQQVTHIVRGADLLDNTARQICLQQSLGMRNPFYAHIPLATNHAGEKLSKQTYAHPLPVSDTPRLMALALSVLGHTPPPELQGAPSAEQLGWACAHWNLENIPRGITLPYDPRFENGTET